MDGRGKMALTTLSVILLCGFCATANGLLRGATKIDELRAFYLRIEQNMWEIVEKETDQSHTVKQLFEGHRVFIDENMAKVYSENDFHVLDAVYEWKLLENDLVALNNLFEAFRFLLQQNHEHLDQLAATDFTDTVLKDTHWPVNETFEKIDNIMVKQGMYYKAMLEAGSQVCATRQSAQQVVFQLYNAISITELKGYAMMQFSWMLLKTFGKGNFTTEAQLMRDRFTERTLKTQEVIRKVMERADRTVWRCDPSHHIEGETYVAVTRLLQGYVENEVDMNNDNTCRENCGAYQFTESYGCYKELYCARQPKCSGKILNCQFFDSDMWICPSKTSSLRRYEFIEYENGRVLGKQGSCSTGTTKVDSWWRWLFWHCSYCLCVCDEQGPKSDRYFNLRESTSNVTANRVVTGLRIQKVNRIIHIQIQEGELLPRGMINETSLNWKPISDYKLLDRGIRNGQDYHTLSWDKRAIDLDDLIAPASHVVTGVRFRVIGTHLNFEIRVTELDFATGQLIDPETTSIWMSNDNTDSSADRRTPVKLNTPDVPILSPSKSVQDSKTNQYVEFTHSDIGRDVGQTTVPYLDAQDVISFPPVALSGAGIYHKGQPLYGGFVGIKLFTYDFGPHIQVPTPSSQEEIKIVPLKEL